MSANANESAPNKEDRQVLRPGGQPLFQALIEHSVDAIALVDSQGKVLYVSPSIQNLLGYTEEELLGRVAFELIHPDDHEKTVAVLGAVAQDAGASSMVEYRLLHKDGSWRWMEATATNMLHDPKIGAIVGNFHDITERKRVEFLLEGQSRVLEMVAQGVELREALEVLARLIEDLSTNDVLASILLLDEDGVHLRHGAAPSLPVSYNEVINGITIGPAVGSCGTAAYTKRRVIVSDIASDPLWADFKELALEHNLRACWSTPILSSTRQMLGTFALYYTKPRYPDVQDRQMIDFLIRSAAIAIERRQAEEALEKRRDEFISMASHELKTPVTSLKGYTQILHRRFTRRNDEESFLMLARMDTQLNKLTRLINDLLDVPRVQSGQLAYREEYFDLQTLLQEMVENMQGVTTSHRLLLEGQVYAPVYGDKDRIGQVLTNLLINAIKYSPEADSVVVCIATEQDRAIVSVQDFGIGIAEVHHKHLFERFYRASDAEVNTYPGMGIGLYISSEIMKRHHGEMWVESRKGAGSTFSFALPLKE